MTNQNHTEPEREGELALHKSGSPQGEFNLKKEREKVWQSIPFLISGEMTSIGFMLLLIDQDKEFIKRLKEEIIVGCKLKMDNIVIGYKGKIKADICGEKGYLCFDCQERLKLIKKINTLAGEDLK